MKKNDLSDINKTNLESSNPSKILSSFLRSFLMPTLIGKSLVLYFGINYSSHPGEGYGYGLMASILFTFCSLVLFAWKFRNHEDL